MFSAFSNAENRKGFIMNAVTQRETETRPERRVSCITPEVNIFEDKDGYHLECEMPGVSKDGLELTLEGHELTIYGRRKEEQLQGEVIFRESRPMDYRRVFELDPTIDTSKLSAKMEQGVLKLYLPKTEKVKPRKITIND